MEIWIPSLLVLACLGVYSSTETDPNSSTDNHFVICILIKLYSAHMHTGGVSKTKLRTVTLLNFWSRQEAVCCEKEGTD